MVKQSRKEQFKRNRIYRRQACNGDVDLIQKVGCAGTACWYNCSDLCEEWEKKHKKHWGMHDDYNRYNKLRKK